MFTNLFECSHLRSWERMFIALTGCAVLQCATCIRLHPFFMHHCHTTHAWVLKANPDLVVLYYHKPVSNSSIPFSFFGFVKEITAFGFLAAKCYYPFL